MSKCKHKFDRWEYDEWICSTCGTSQDRDEIDLLNQKIRMLTLENDIKHRLILDLVGGLNGCWSKSRHYKRIDEYEKEMARHEQFVKEASE